MPIEKIMQFKIKRYPNCPNFIIDSLPSDRIRIEKQNGKKKDRNNTNNDKMFFFHLSSDKGKFRPGRRRLVLTGL